MFEIKPANEYPKDYNAVVNQAKQEKADDVRPELVSLGNVKAYDILFIGTPVWWYTMASPVKTFLAENNFDGKLLYRSVLTEEEAHLQLIQICKNLLLMP